MEYKYLKLIFLFCLFFLVIPSPSLRLDCLSPAIIQEDLQHEVKVTLKMIQVYVTDKKGNPVTELKKEDFNLYDNGELQKIIGFETHFLAFPVKEREKEPTKKTTPEPEQNLFPQMNRKFFLLFDAVRNTPYGIKKSKDAALHFMDTQLKSTDEVAVLSYNNIRFLVLHQYLTTDHEKVRQMIKDLKLLPKVSEGMPFNPSGGIQIISGKEHLSSSSYSEGKAKANIFTKQLKDLAKSFRSIPGYKSLIYFSQGFSSSMLHAPDQTFREKYEDAGKELASSSTAVYTVNTAAGESRHSYIWAKGDDSLKMISELSGGKYFEDVEYYQEIAHNINQTTGNYYVLGYYIDDKWDGAFHEIKVKVNRKDCTVQSQSGYFNPKPFSEFTEFEKKLHLIDLALNDRPYHQIPVEIPSVALSCPGEEQSNLVLLSRLPMKTMKEIIQSQTELVVFIFDEQRNIVDSRKGELTLHEIDKDNIFHYILTSVPAGLYQNRVIIRNLKTGKAAVASSSIEVNPLPEQGMFLYPPLLLEPEKEAFFIHTLKKEKGEREEEAISLKDIYPFISSRMSPLVDSLEKGTSKILAVTVNAIKGIENPDVHLTAELANKSTNEKTLLNSRIISGQNKGSADILLLELELPELESGEYFIEITAVENTTGITSRQKTKTFLIY